MSDMLTAHQYLTQGCAAASTANAAAASAHLDGKEDTGAQHTLVAVVAGHQEGNGGAGDAQDVYDGREATKDHEQAVGACASLSTHRKRCEPRVW